MTCPYAVRWLGGVLSNSTAVLRNISALSNREDVARLPADGANAGARAGALFASITLLMSLLRTNPLQITQIR